jgi:hypothetical protein
MDRVIRLLHLSVHKMADMLYQQLNSQSNADSGNSQRALISIHVVTDSPIDWIGSKRAIASASLALALYESFEVTTRGSQPSPYRVSRLYRVARSRLTHFELEYCAGAIACRGWRQGEQ